MNRRSFLQNSLYSSLLFGAGGLPSIAGDAQAAFEPLRNRVLAMINLRGGPDMRHLVAPAMPDNVTTAARNSKEYKYWLHRHKSQNVASNEAAWQARWNNEYHHITINDGSVNQGTTFGIWKGAGWLIKMYEAGNVAFVANTAIGRNRAHDRSSIQLRQGNVYSSENDLQRSGWGGRLARFSNQNSISVTRRSTPFCFGPVDTPVYNPNAIDNRSFLSISDSRRIGLFEANLDDNQTYQTDDKFARSLKTYYQSLRTEFNKGALDKAYEKVMDHETKVRLFGNLLRQRLDFDVPTLIKALYDNVPGINDDPGDGSARRVLRRRDFGYQIRNLYDCMASNDLLDMRVAGLSYGGWDSHGRQADRSNNADKYDPGVDNRGIEQGFRDIFGGPLNSASTDPHGGLSALYETLSTADKNKLVFVVAGEFGRQIRQNDNSQSGTDHGDGNIVMVIGNGVRGAVYGDLFPESENSESGYDAPEYRTPDIESLTEMEHVFAPVCNWVSTNPTAGGSANSGQVVFPRLRLSTGDEEYPDLEAGVSLANLFTT